MYAILEIVEGYLSQKYSCGKQFNLLEEYSPLNSEPWAVTKYRQVGPKKSRKVWPQNKARLKNPELTSTPINLNLIRLWYQSNQMFLAQVARNFSYSPATPSYAICSLPKLVRHYRKTILLSLKIGFSCKICTVFFYTTTLKLTFS